MQTNEKMTTSALYEEIFKGCKMGADSVVDLLPKVKDEALKTELTTQLSRYEDFADRARSELLSRGVTPKEEGLVTRLSAKMGVMMNTMIDATSSHIAGMIMEGCTMGTTDLLKAVHAHGEDSSASSLAREVISFEEEAYEDMKRFL